MPDHVGQQLGNYRLIRLLGHGGFASVYLGEHIHLGTLAAIKVLNRWLVHDELENFSNEARTIARLEHPHIVRVLDFGVEGQLPFLVMSYAPNGTLRQRHPKGARLPLATIVPYVKQVAAALQYAHDARLIHRDIKPENMLLGRNDEVLLSDFGLAVIARGSSHQSAQDMSGTIAYMAPEQARGMPRPASDQYALAVAVYEWLCGTRPFNGTYEEIAVQHVLTPPPSMCEKMPGIAPALEEVVLKALAKDPHQRYARVQDFADALEQLCQSELGMASTPSLSTPVKTAVTSALEGSIYSTAHTPEQTPPEMVYAVAWSPDRQHVVFGKRDRTVQVVRVTTSTRLFTYYGHAGAVTAVAWSPNGLLIASASLDKTIQVWDASSGEKISTYNGHSGMIFAMSWSPDSRYLASTSGSTDNIVQIWDVATGRTTVTYHGHSYWTRALAWSPDGRHIASGSWREVQLWDSATGRKVSTYRGHNGWVRAVAWSPDGTHLASASEDKTVQIWEPVKGRMITTHRGHADWVGIVLWSPNGKHIASASKDHVVHVWDAVTGNNICTQQDQSTSAYAIEWLPDGKHIASINGSGAVHVWQAL
jgi:serine/threonine protein kinase